MAGPLTFALGIHIATALELGCEEFITTNKRRGPLNAECVAKLATLGLRVIDATQTAILPEQYQGRPESIGRR